MTARRLFVALRPPAAVRDYLCGLMGGIANARWQDDAQLHLTLRFIGEVDRHAAADVDAALAAIHHPSFSLAVKGLGQFEKRGAVHTLWAAIDPAEPVRHLHMKVDQAVMRAGLPPEPRAFHPHITLARLNRSAGPVQDFLARSPATGGPSFDVACFSLFESVLTPAGAVYEELERYPLR